MGLCFTVVQFQLAYNLGHSNGRNGEKMAKKDETTATVRLINPDPKKNSVKFDSDPSDPKPILTGAYIMRQSFKDATGIDLATVKAIEVSVRVAE